MAQETKHLSALDVNNGVTWNNASNAYSEDDNIADATDMGAAGEYCGGNYADTTETPTALDNFYVRFYDINTEHDDDTYQVQIYNSHTSAWEVLETFDSGSKLPPSLTTKDYSSDMGTKFNAASDKQAFINGLQLRFYQSAKSKGGDNINIGLAWSKVVYTISDNINITPTAASSVAAALIGAVILGSVTIAPTAASAVRGGVNPTTVLGSLSITPTAASSIQAAIDPTIILGSLSVSPNAGSSVSGRNNPTIVLSSMSVSPTAISSVGNSVNPTTVLGSISLTPTALSSVSASVNPTTVLGSISITPTAISSIGNRVNPTLILGSMSISPTAISSVAASIDPTITVSGGQHHTKYQGRVAIVTTGTAVFLGDAQEMDWIVVYAPMSNRRIIKIGSSTVTTNESSTDGIPLIPGMWPPVKIDASDRGDTYINGYTGDCIYYVADSKG